MLIYQNKVVCGLVLVVGDRGRDSGRIGCGKDTGGGRVILGTRGFFSREGGDNIKGLWPHAG